MIPHHMYPASRYSAATLQAEVACPGCWQTYVLGTGVVYETYYTLKGQEQKFGDVFFCSLSCLLRYVHPGGAS